MGGKQIVKGLTSMIIKVVLAIIIVAAIYKIATTCYNFGFRIFAEEAMDPDGGTEVTVAIVEGKSVKEIGTILKEKGLIRDANLFYIQEMVSGEHGKLQAGVYTLNTNMTPKDIIRILAEGPVETTDEDGSSSAIVEGTDSSDESSTDSSTQEDASTQDDN